MDHSNKEYYMVYGCICIYILGHIWCIYMYINVFLSLENTIVVCSQDPDNVAVISKPLLTAIQEFCTGLCSSD